MLLRLLILTLAVLAVWLAGGISSPEEASGIVGNILAGDTFEVIGLGCVRLADVDSPEPTTMDGLHAKEFTRDILQNVQVFLDLEEEADRGPDCLVAVVYMANSNGTANVNKNFNRIIVEAGHAVIKDDPENEFDPADW